MPKLHIKKYRGEVYGAGHIPVEWPFTRDEIVMWGQTPVTYIQPIGNGYLSDGYAWIKCPHLSDDSICVRREHLRKTDKIDKTEGL